ncbi:MAG TPA: hypothetical protein PLS55_07080, partial [Thermogutta sp.]|nr:hypothetical protein [Thermogutta sp.]
DLRDFNGAPPVSGISPDTGTLPSQRRGAGTSESPEPVANADIGWHSAAVSPLQNRVNFGTLEFLPHE